MQQRFEQGVWVVACCFPLFPLDNTKVLCFFDFAIGLSVVASRYRMYPTSFFKRKLISNSAVSNIVLP